MNPTEVEVVSRTCQAQFGVLKESAPRFYIDVVNRAGVMNRMIANGTAISPISRNADGSGTLVR